MPPACLPTSAGASIPTTARTLVFRRMLHHPFLAIDHHERVTLALILFVRLGGKLGRAALLDPASSLLDEVDKQRALAVGNALRLAYAVSGGAADILDDSALRLDGKRVELVLSGKALPEGPQVAKSFKQLLRATRTEGRIVTPDPATV